MKHNPFHFSRLRTSEVGETNQDMNVGCIEAIEFENRIVLLAEPNFTQIKHGIVIHKDGKIGVHRDEISDDAKLKKRISFSLFMGLFQIEGRVSLVFVDRVKPIKIEQHFVFEVNSVVAYWLDTFFPDLELSEYLTQTFSGCCYFSFTIDLSNSKDYLNITSAELRPISPNFFFMHNLGLIEMCIGVYDRGWLVPVIYGQITKIVNPKFTMYLIYKESVLDNSSKIREDIYLLSNFFCPTSMRITDILLVQNSQLKSVVRVVLNNYPGIIMSSDRKANSYEGLNYNSNRIYRYYQFFNEFMDCSKFILVGTHELIDIMRKLQKFYLNKMESKESLLIDKIIPLEESKANKLIPEAIKILISVFISELDAINYGSVPIMCFSLCTENQYGKLGDIVLSIVKQLFINKMPNGYSDRVPLLFSEGTNGEQKFLAHLITFCSKASELNKRFEKNCKISLKKHKLLNSFGSLGRVILKMYGSKKLMSMFFEKIIKRRKLDVFNYHEIKMSIITHNCSGETPKQKSDLGYANNPQITDSNLIVLCLQEIIEMKSKNLRSILYSNNGDAENQWTKIIKDFFPGFYFVGKVSLVGLMVVILINRQSQTFLELSLEKQAEDKLGFMKLLANKGSIFLDLKVNYERIKISNSHLDAGNADKQNNVRLDQLKNILSIYEEKKYSNIGIICGDMNFRLNLTPFDAQMLIMDGIQNPEKQSSYINSLLSADKLTQSLQQGDKDLQQLIEYPISFLPSYKKRPGSNEYCFDRQVPAW
jgi:hypothetical protein